MNAPRDMGAILKQSGTVVESHRRALPNRLLRHRGRRPLLKLGGLETAAAWGLLQVPTLLYKCHVKQFWLVKSEPSSYSWANLVTDGKTAWTGVRNYTARNNLRAMRKGDAVFFYHSVVGKDLVGVAKVIREAYPDPTATEGEWSAVDLAPEKALPKPVSLDEIKRNPKLKEMALLRLSRLSVQPVTATQFEEIARMGG
jgi:predicted RNA-binding protein with PUA-like domain